MIDDLYQACVVPVRIQILNNSKVMAQKANKEETFPKNKDFFKEIN